MGQPHFFSGFINTFSTHEWVKTISRDYDASICRHVIYAVLPIIFYSLPLGNPIRIYSFIRAFKKNSRKKDIVYNRLSAGYSCCFLHILPFRGFIFICRGSMVVAR
jgi:hypothetical protein